MALSDQTLYCRDCNQPFTFTVGEQEFYASRGLTNAPSRCPSCRAARRQSGGQGGYGGGRSSGGGGGGGYREREPRQMYTATCASCGQEAQVPFQPREDRPVYCSNCYQSQGQGSSGGRRNDRGGSDRRSRW
jgi:CxxC-x17-CxxC domain-containing protein